ncbi:MAG: hypothetical protein A2W25_08945 [candidate division Zixibacteria bacterium RBG_16_53_22]|nr:MAG: hypothetical protein A2W25_08945 [candidate division Zixibacteria bacterium RBG_16_53_22]
MISIKDLPTVNALLNLTSAILLFIGRIQIKKGRADRHKKIMITALVSSAFFLTSYLIYHGAVGSVPYGRFDWTRPLYFIILVPHIILAGLMAPFILLAVYYALRQKFDQHRRLVRWVWPVWMFVSMSGIVVYVMLYHL